MTKKNFNKNISVIGLGYVGLPLAIEFSKKFNVVGFDLNKNRIEELINCVDRTSEISKEELKKTDIKFTSLEDDLLKTNIYIVTVPTPVDRYKNPNLQNLKAASELVGSLLNKNNLVIYESTVFPGATEELCIPILEKASGLKLNKDFYCGYSPERVNPGDKDHKLIDILKITSGSNKKALKMVDDLYQEIINAGTYKAESIKVAEAAKVIENTQRDLNIALINELSILFKKMNIDTLDVLEAAQTKWNFLPFKPGLVGGHCIGVDPYYLTYKAQELGYSPQIILAGRRINDNMSKWIVEQLIMQMARNGLPISKAKVLILGLTFKENCTDIRNTKVEDIYRSLNQYDIETFISDPYVDIEEANKKFEQRVYKSIPDEIDFEAIIVAVSHDEYKLINNKKWKSLIKTNGVIFDLKGILPRDIGAIRL